MGCHFASSTIMIEYSSLFFGHSTLIGHVIKDFKISRDQKNKEIIYSVLGINMFKHIRIVFI